MVKKSKVKEEVKVETPAAEAKVEIKSEPKLTRAQSTWESVKKMEINVFGVIQKVEDFYTFHPIHSSDLYLKSTVSAALPALETTLGPDYQVTATDFYTVVKKG